MGGPWLGLGLVSGTAGVTSAVAAWWQRASMPFAAAAAAAATAAARASEYSRGGANSQRRLSSFRKYTPRAQMGEAARRARADFRNPSPPPTATHALPPPRPCLHLPALCTTHAAHAAALHIAKPTAAQGQLPQGGSLRLPPQPRALVVLFILAIHPWPGIDSTAVTWQLSTPRRRLRLEVCTALPRPTASR